MVFGKILATVANKTKIKKADKAAKAPQLTYEQQKAPEEHQRSRRGCQTYPRKRSNLPAVSPGSEIKATKAGAHHYVNPPGTGKRYRATGLA